MREQEEGPEQVARGQMTAWRKWFVFFWPLFVVLMAGIKWLGLAIMIPIMTAFFAFTLIYQRYVKRRAWSAILWGRLHSNPR